MTKTIESLRKSLIQTRKQLDEVREDKRALLWQLRGHNITREEYDKRYQQLIQQERELVREVEDLEFDLLLERLKSELEANRHITAYFRSLTRGLLHEIGTPQILGLQVKLPCNHRLDIIKYISELKKADKTRARLLASRLFDTVMEIQRIEQGTRGTREFRIVCPTCKAQYGMTIELKAIPKATR